MLVFDSAYSLRLIEEYNLENNLFAVDPNKFFDQIYFVNVAAAAQRDVVRGDLVGKPQITKINDEVFVCEPKFGRFKILKFFKNFNLFLSLLSLVPIILRFNKEHRLTVVRAEDPAFNGLLGYFFAKMLKAPLILGVWGNPQRIRAHTNRPLSPRIFRTKFIEAFVEKFLLLRANTVLVQNLENTNYPLSLGVAKESIRVIPIGLWVNNLFVNAELNLSAKSTKNPFHKFEFSLFCVSRLENSKYIEDLIHISKLLKGINSHFKLSIIGDGAQLVNLKNLTAEFELTENIEFLGWKSQKWMIDNLVNYDLGLCLLAGRSLLEGALLGIPFVGYDIDWHSELVVNGETGILVPVGNLEAFADAIYTIWSDAQFRRQLGNNIKKLAMVKNNDFENARILDEVYKNISLV